VLGTFVKVLWNLVSRKSASAKFHTNTKLLLAHFLYDFNFPDRLRQNKK
jgi:hypothetical protein